MRPRRTFLAMAIGATMSLGLGISACGSDGGSGPNTNVLVASWNATSFTALGQDFIANGMGLVLTLNQGGTYSIAVTGDQGDLICSPGPTCTQTGDYSSTSTVLTFDPGTPDAVSFNWSLQGTTLTLTGSISGNPATMVLQKL